MKYWKRLTVTRKAPRTMGANDIYGFTCPVFPRFPSGPWTHTSPLPPELISRFTLQLCSWPATPQFSRSAVTPRFACGRIRSANR